MKSLKSRLVVAAVLLFAVSGSPVKSQDAPQEAVVSNAALPQAKLPVLKIGGKENADVYLQSLDIMVEVTGNIASTRYTMVFKNKTNRILEGELTFPLPDGRSVTHYALDINGKMREAVPVEKAKGTQVFEEIQQRRVDPGLLERVEGNNLRTRIYPIPANGARTISIGYEEELTLEKGLLYYRLPMAYPNPLEKFAVKATVWKGSQKPLVPESKEGIRFDKAGENYVASFSRSNYRPSRALIFALPAPADIPQVMMQPAQGSYYFLASVAPKMETRKKQWADDLAIIWDVSLSGSQRNLQREMEMLKIIFAEKKNVNVHLYLLNNKVVKKGEYKIAGGKWENLKKVLETAVFDGGTDFSKIKLNDIAGNEVLFFSDGISTLSDADFLKNSKANRPIHCVVSSAKADYSAMKLIAGKTKGKFVNVNALSAEKLKNELLNETLQFLGTEHEDVVNEVYPSIATPVQGNFSVAGISGANEAELTLLFGFGDKAEKRIKVKLDAKKAADEGNVYKIWAQKKIAELDLNYEKNRAELMELGQQFGIVTRNTSLIVLETISDYVLYGIEPPAAEPELRAEYRRRTDGSGTVKPWAVAVESAGSATAAPSSAARGNARSGGASGSGGSAANRSRSFAFESAEVIGYLDSPTPVYIIDMDDPSSDQLSLDRSFKSALKENADKETMERLSRGGSAGGGDPPARVTGGKTPAAGTDSGSVPGGSNVVHAPQPKAVPAQTMDSIASARATEEAAAREREEAAAREKEAREKEALEKEALKAKSAMFRAAVLAAEKLQKWWNTDFKFTPQKPKYPMPDERAENSNTGSAKGGAVKNTDYMKKMTGKTADDYQIYLKVRNDHAGSPAFYFDVANWFYTLGDKETALRVLTSIADLELENASLYRLLGYRFKEYGEYALEKFVCQKVVQWRPMEPQSYRDYALALADNGEKQAALDSLYSLLTKSYSDNITGRSHGTDEVTVTEINHLIAKNPKLKTSKIDERLIINIPVDIRVVINWNMDNTDIDLHVKDPNGEECYYSRRETKIGGRISTDNTSGYGPEQFLLKKAVKGRYQVYVNYYSDRQFTAAGPSTIMAEIYTKYADKTEQRKIAALQMSNAKKTGDGKVMVAEFDF
jgi:hypothetical protein